MTGRTDVFRADGTAWWVSFAGTGPGTRLNGSTYKLGGLGFGGFNGDGRADVFRTRR